MNRLNKKHGVSLKRQRGFSLIEALVAFLILSVGMLGIASLQVISLKAGSTAVMRTIVVMKVEEMFERMRNNPAVINLYQTSAAVGVDNSCNDYGTFNVCTPEQMVQYDIYAWIEELKTRMPNTDVSAVISVTDAVPGTRPTAVVAVTVNWKERSTETQTLEDMSYTTSAHICPNTSC